MKNKKTSAIFLILIGIFVIVLGIIFIFPSNNNNDKNDDNSITLEKVKTLLENDYIISKALYGIPVTKDVPNVTIDNAVYNLVDDNNITTIESLQKLINRTYTDDLLENSMVDFNKYNAYVEIEKKLYVNINSKCSIDKFDNKITLSNETDDEITVNVNNKTITVIKDANIYKLKDSAYQCE